MKNTKKENVKKKPFTIHIINHENKRKKINRKLSHMYYIFTNKPGQKSLIFNPIINSLYFI